MVFGFQNRLANFDCLQYYNKSHKNYDKLHYFIFIEEVNGNVCM